jgi:ribosomal protein S18 acetylase RimI-like enzyme
MTLRPATAADFGFIRGLTRDPAYAPFVGDTDEAGLAAWAADPAVRVLIWGDQAGFVVFREVGSPSGAVELFRLALARVNGGGGAGFVRALTDHAFAALGAKRVWLDASGENGRAHRVYVAAGYQVEGRLRAHWFRPVLGRSVDLVIYGMLRAEWQALRAA